MKTFLFLCVFHVVGDYVLQWQNMANKKRPFNRYFIGHILLYALSMAAVFLCAPFTQAAITWLVLSISHMSIDIIRYFVDKKYEDKPVTKCLSLSLDQFLHLSLIFICYWFIMRSHPGLLNTTLFLQRWFHIALGYIVILCIIWRPSGIFISKVLDIFPLNGGSSASPVDEKTLNAGAAIGFLERIIVIVLVLLNAPTAIGFVLTAKSVARFKQFEDNPPFTERYLIGTLLSVGIALLLVFLFPKIYTL